MSWLTDIRRLDAESDRMSMAAYRASPGLHWKTLGILLIAIPFCVFLALKFL